MPSNSESRYAFTVEWYDPNASLMRQYQLIYYASDGTLEMYDIKNRRTFLKRCDYPAVSVKDLYKGGIITVYSRQLTIKGYADSFTAGVFGTKAAMTVALVLPSALQFMGKVVDAVLRAGFAVSELKMLTLSEGEASDIYQAGELAKQLSVGPVLALKLTHEDAVTKLHALVDEVVGPQLGNAIACSMDAASAEKEAAMLFAAPSLPLADVTLSQSSLLVIRPHAVRSGSAGQILDQLMVAFGVLNMQMLQMTRPNAHEFLEVYKGVVPEFTEPGGARQRQVHCRAGAEPRLA